MTIQWKRNACIAAILTVAAWMALPARASAATPVGVHIREATVDANGVAHLILGVTGAPGTLNGDAFTVTEDGRPVSGLTLQPLDARTPVAVVLLIDTSGSTNGRPLADAKNAAEHFAAGLPGYVRIALVSFSDRPSLRVPFTTDHGRVVRAIAGLNAGGGTAIFDSVRLAASLLGAEQAQRNIVLFTDGDDSSSGAKLRDAVDAARSAKAPIAVIGLSTPQLSTSTLDALASGTGGSSIAVSGSGGLQGAFSSAARDLASQYQLSYNTKGTGSSELQISVAVMVGGASSSDQIVAFSPRSAAPVTSGSGSSVPAGPLVPAFTSPVGLLIGGGAAFAAFSLLLFVLLSRPKKTKESATLSRALRLYVRGANREKGRQRRQEGGSALARRAAGLVDKMPKPAGYEDTLQQQLDRAGWPFRAAEFLAIQAGAAVAGGVVGLVLLGKWWLGVVLAGLVPFVLKAVLTRKVAARGSAFLAQLPDTLQLLAGSLQAGYGFMQAIDTLVREAPAPTSSEFQRVLSEARLGMPVEDALNAMAERLGSEDFKWVVLAINIQRQVGGNLAMLLRTVADTLRERERVRRQIKVLSAEGRLSAWILGVLPFGIAGYIMMVNPTFLTTMTTDPLGRLMIGGSLVMLGLGVVWMRKIIRIEV
ncbi:MAG: VWA domain-containing protein [Actinomycetota bacterium]